MKTYQKKWNDLSKPVKAFVNAFRRAVADTPAGLEPGLQRDFIYANLVYNNSLSECKIKVLEYSSLNTRESRVLNNREFIEYLQNPEGTLRDDQWEDVVGLTTVWDGVRVGTKKKVTWINIGGISWDVVKELQSKFCEQIHFTL